MKYRCQCGKPEEIFDNKQGHPDYPLWITSEIEYAIGVYEKLEADNKRLSEENEILRADLRSATSQLHEIDREYQRIWAELQGMKEPDTNPTTRTYPDAITP